MPEPRSDRLGLLAASVLLSIALLFHGGMAMLILDLSAIGQARQPLLISDVICFRAVADMVALGQLAEAYDNVALYAFEQVYVPDLERVIPWQYPPIALLWLAPLAWVPLWLGQVLLPTLGLVALSVALWPLMPRHPLRPLAIVSFGAIIACFWIGQTGLWVAALMAAGWGDLSRDHHRRAGLWFGLLAFKPHLAVLVPLFLAAQGRWQSFGVAALVVAVQVLITWGLWGSAPWLAFLSKIQGSSALIEGIYAPHTKAVSFYVQLRLWGLPHVAAIQGHGVLAVGALLWFFWVLRRPVSAGLQFAAMLCATVFLSPYMWNYDLTVLAVAMALLAQNDAQHGHWSWVDLPFWLLLWLGPILSMMIFDLGIVAGFYAMVAGVVLLTHRIIVMRPR